MYFIETAIEDVLKKKPSAHTAQRCDTCKKLHKVSRDRIW
jgi:hypothetical protein